MMERSNLMRLFASVALVGLAGTLFASDVKDHAPLATSLLENVMARAFQGSKVRIQEGLRGTTTTLVLEGREGVEAEKVEVSHELSVDLADGAKALVISASMADRLRKAHEAIDHQRYIQRQETAYLMIVVEAEGGQVDVHRMCAADTDEVSGFYGEYEELAMLGPNRKQVGVSYTSCFQDEDTMGMRKRRIIYDLPSGRQIFCAIIGDASTAVSDRGQKWILSYHKSSKSVAKGIHRVKEGSNEAEIYEFNGTAFVFDRTESTLAETPLTFRNLGEYYRKLMEWRGRPVEKKDAFSKELISMAGDVVFDGLKDEELTKIVKAAYPKSRRIEIVERIMEPSRWGDVTNWTGEVEFRLEDANSPAQRLYLVWPARCVLTNGATTLSGLILPNRTGYRAYQEFSREHAKKKVTTEAAFACVKIDPQGGETGYRDVLADGVYGIRELVSGSRSRIQFVPGQGLFREVITRMLKAGNLPADAETALIEEARIHIYELVNQKLVFQIPYWGTCGGTNFFTAGGEPQWKDVDGDHVVELIIKDSERSAHIYKWQQDTYAYWKHGNIEPDPKPYRPSGLNPPVKVTIVVKDEDGLPVDACDIKGEITTKHQNVLELFKEPKVQYAPVVKTTDANGRAVLESKAFSITLEISKSGYTSQKVRLRPFAEPIPDVLNITLRKAP